MAEPIVSFVLETIGKLLSEEAKFLSEVSDEAKRLHSELKMMRAFLKDADGKQHEADIVQEWVSQCRDLAYEAENVLEDYAFRLESKMRKKGTLSVVKRLACILSESRTRHKLGLEIQDLKTSVFDLIQRFYLYGIRAADEGGESSTARQQQMMRTTYSYVANDEDVVGFKDDVDKLVKALVKKDAVVSITGMGGSGKTTLARKVYNHPDVKSHFDSFAWVCVSQQWETRNLLKGILVCFLPMDKRGDIDKLTDNEMVVKLGGILKGKKCLLVLDDIWSTDAWECIKVAFPSRNEGSHSKILITTRNVNVAEHIGPNGYHHPQRLLNDDESLKLLMKRATWPNPEYCKNIQKLKAPVNDMVKFCKGLPLALVVLGGLLATKHSSAEWISVSENIRSYLGKGERIGEGKGEIQSILALSYSDLLYKLKPCFLYLSAFAEDEDIEVDSLYNLWMAEGMVSAQDRIDRDESMKEIADRYLGELAKRCIVMVKETEQPSHGRYRSCQLHDLMRDMCKAKAEEENFMKVLDYGEGYSNISSSTGNTHRITISLSPANAARFSPIQMGACKALRTLVFCGTVKYHDFSTQLLQLQMNRFKMLRSLIMVNMWAGGPFKLPLSELIHLRYIRLTCCSLAMSPSSISNLEHLEILDLEDSSIEWTKSVPIRTRRLRYLHVPLYSYFPMEIYVPSDIEVIKGRLGKDFHIKSLSELVNIRELGNFFVDDAKILGDLCKCISSSRHLKAVGIVGPPNSIFSQQRLSLLELLFCSTSNVQSLFLGVNLGKLPEYDSGFLKSLVSLTLWNSEIEEDPMKMIEKLPNLQKLQLWFNAFLGKEMVCHSMGFPQLRYLELCKLPNLETWTVEKGAMPNLSHFEIDYCDCLSMIPEQLELHFCTQKSRV